MEYISHFILPSQTNSLYTKEARSSLALAKEIASKINELIDNYNSLSREDLSWKQEEEGRIRGAILYLKDNLYNTLSDLLNNVDMVDIVSADVRRELYNRFDELKVMVNTLVDGSPSGAYRNINELNAYGIPSKIYVLTNDNGWYYHNGTEWQRGGDYLSSLAGLYSIPGSAIKFSEIKIVNELKYDSSTKELFFPYPVYYSGEDNTQRPSANFLDVKEDVTLDLSSVNSKQLIWIVYDELNKHITYKTAQDIWSDGLRVIALYIGGKFYGVNKDCIVIEEDEDSKPLNNSLGVTKALKKDVASIKFLGDSITAGVGATGYVVTSELLVANKYKPSKDSSCWVNLLGAYLKNKCENRFNYISPDVNNVKVKGIYSYLPNKDTLGFLVLRCYDSISFSFTGTSIDLSFIKFTDSGVVSISIDEVVQGTYDLYSASASIETISFTNLSNNSHKVNIVLTGKNPAIQGGTNVAIRFGGAMIDRTVEFKNYGVSGWDSYYGWSYKDTLIESSDDLTFISYGTNDRLTFPSVDAFRGFMEDLILDCISKNSKFVLVTPTPHPSEHSNSNYKFDVIDAVNTIKELAVKYDCVYIDMYNGMYEYANENGLTIESLLSDGLHPNDKGYQAMFEIAKSTLMI